MPPQQQQQQQRGHKRGDRPRTPRGRSTPRRRRRQPQDKDGDATATHGKGRLNQEEQQLPLSDIDDAQLRDAQLCVEDQPLPLREDAHQPVSMHQPVAQRDPAEEPLRPAFCENPPLDDTPQQQIAQPEPWVMEFDFEPVKKKDSGQANSDLLNAAPPEHPCKFCGRKFNKEAHSRHVKICQKLSSKTKKRNRHDSTTARTDTLTVADSKSNQTQGFPGNKAAKESSVNVKKSKWREESARLKECMRAAKQAEAEDKKKAALKAKGRK